jgi:hypothetical protein
MLALLTSLPVAAPALPLDEAGKYVAGAYVVFLVLLVVYLGIMAAKVQRIERELRELAQFAEQGRNTSEDASRSDLSRPSEVVSVGLQGGSHPPAADAERSTRAEADV